jgi:hypothetical protein
MERPKGQCNRHTPDNYRWAAHHDVDDRPQQHQHRVGVQTVEIDHGGVLQQVRMLQFAVFKNSLTPFPVESSDPVRETR